MSGSPNALPPIPNRPPAAPNQRTSLRRYVGCSAFVLTGIGIFTYSAHWLVGTLNEGIESGAKPEARYSAPVTHSATPREHVPSNNKPVESAEPAEESSAAEPKTPAQDANTPPAASEQTDGAEDNHGISAPIPGDNQCWWSETNPQQLNSNGKIYTDSDCGGAGPTVGYRFVNAREFNTNETKQIPDGTAVTPICEWPGGYIGVNMAGSEEPADPYLISASKVGYYDPAKACNP